MRVTLASAVAALLLVAAGVAAQAPAIEIGEPPATLAETGLGILRVRSFAPAYPLWTDGAAKRRWIHVPPGTAIDASDPDAWQFPVGTRLWKEFAFAGAPTETRYMVRTADGWRYATYVWNPDGTATRAPAAGAPSVELAPGVRHQVPGDHDCKACHEGGPTPVLGFAAVQLAAELPDLVAAGVVRGLPAELVEDPPRIAGTPLERAALGYLHGNCGGCHRADGPLASLGMVLAQPARGDDPVARTAIGRPSRFRAPGLRIAPGDPDASVLLTRMRARTPVAQMPPLGTRLVDDEATQLVADWIAQLATEPPQEKER